MLHSESVLCVRDTCRYVNDFEAALFGSNFADPVMGWRMYGNPTTFVDFFLTSEIIKNAKHTYHGTSFANKVGCCVHGNTSNIWQMYMHTIALGCLLGPAPTYWKVGEGGERGGGGCLSTMSSAC